PRPAAACQYPTLSPAGFNVSSDDCKRCDANGFTASGSGGLLRFPASRRARKTAELVHLHFVHRAPSMERCETCREPELGHARCAVKRERTVGYVHHPFSGEAIRLSGWRNFGRRISPCVAL